MIDKSGAENKEQRIERVQEKENHAFSQPATDFPNPVSHLPQELTNTDHTRDFVLAIVAYHDEPLSFLKSTLNALALQTQKPEMVLVTASNPENKAKHETLAKINALCKKITTETTIPYRLTETQSARNLNASISHALSFLTENPEQETDLRSFMQSHEPEIPVQNRKPKDENVQPDEKTKPHTALHTARIPAESWLWILHADSAPFPNTLELMLKTGTDSRLIGAIGPKQVFWQAHSDGSYDLLEAGIKATRLARRVPEIILGERDQGQLDRREDVLAVGTAGMLIRGRILQEIGGFNENLGPFGDGLEISRRIRYAGYRVVVCPAARIRHAQLSLRPELKQENLQENGSTETPQKPIRAKHAEISDHTFAKSYAKRRSAQIFNALTAIPACLFLPALIGFPIAALARSIIRLIRRDYLRATGELQATAVIFTQFCQILASRSKISLLKKKNKHNTVRRLEAKGKAVRHAKRARREARSEAAKMSLLPDPLTLQAHQDLTRNRRRGFLYALLTALLFTIVLFIPYFTAETLTGGQLTLDTTTGTDLWNAALHSRLLSGDGHNIPIDPLWLLYLPVLLLGQPLGITLGYALTFTLYLAPLIGVCSAYAFTRIFTRSPLLCYGVSLLWILAPPLITALHEGRIGAVIIHITLPLFASGIYAGARKNPGAIGFAALILAIISAGAPILMLLGTIGAIFACIFTRRTAWLWLPIPALILLSPQLIQLGKLKPADLLTYFLTNPGVPIANSISLQDLIRRFGINQPYTGIWSMIEIITLAILFLIAVLALMRTGRNAKHVRLGWLLGIFGFSCAIAVLYAPALQISTPAGIIFSRPWHGFFLSLTWLGLCIIILAGAHGLRTDLRARSFGMAQVLGILAMFSFPVSLCGLFALSIQIQTNPENQILQPANTNLLPAIAEQTVNSPNRSRVLVLSAAENNKNSSFPHYHAELWRNYGFQLHEYAVLANITRHSNGARDAANQDLSQAIANLLAASPDASKQLQAHGISVVLLPPVTNIHGDAYSTAENTGTDIVSNTPSLQSNTDLLYPAGTNTFTQQSFPNTPERNNLASALHTAPGLEYVTENETGMFWRVVPETGLKTSASALIKDTQGKIYPIPAGEYEINTELTNLPDEGIIELAERADEHWYAQINGKKLTAVKSSNGWAQAWDLNSADLTSAEKKQTVTLQISYSDPLHYYLLGIQIFFALVTILVALAPRSRKSGEIS